MNTALALVLRVGGAALAATALAFLLAWGGCAGDASCDSAERGRQEPHHATSAQGGSR